MAPSHSDVSDFGGDRESADLSDDNKEVPKETIISGLTSLEEDDRLQNLSSASTGQRYLSCACFLSVVVSVASAIFARLFGRLQFLCCD